jgi:uncharacterized membrane protein
MEAIDFSTQNSLFFMPLLVGGIFAIIGRLMYNFPPSDINPLYGYRTKSSMKSQERWDFAQKYSSKLMSWCGLGLMLCSVFGLFLNLSEGKGVLIASTEIFIAIGILIYKTEKAIKKRFGK